MRHTSVTGRAVGRTPIDPALFQRRQFSGNRPSGPLVYGWSIQLGDSATREEVAWLRSRGYVFYGSSWARADRKPREGH